MPKPTKVCEFPECGRPFRSKGLCAGHRRQQLDGRPLKKLNLYLANATPQEKLLAHSEDQGECRVWTGTTGEAYGKAAKGQVQDMVSRLLSLPGLPGTDAADALGVAICHANSIDALAMLGALAPQLQGLRMKRGRLVG